jgi:subtilisin family serine protease/methionine-rich copper-binding protein CopC
MSPRKLISRSRRAQRRHLLIEPLEERAVPDAVAAATFGPFALDESQEPTGLLVRFQPGYDASPSAPGVDALPLVDGLYRIPVGPGMSLASVLDAYRANPDVVYAEPDYRLRITTIPNDPAFGNLWGLHNTGQTGGTPDADIDAPEAWDITTGSSSTLVAVIDTGVDYRHPDLAANMWVNPGEIPGNRRDDDGNGYVDDVHGYDVVNNDGDPMDDNNHGTHVAGTIGAVGNNGVGVTGIAWNVRIMAVKCFDAQGSGSISDAVAAIDYAVRNGAVISNNSWGGNEPFSQALYDAVRRARDAGHIFVAGAGNGNWLGIGQDNDADPFYPANLDLDNIISVAATDHTDQRAFFSNYGATSVDLAAPGVDIRSTTRNNTYNTFSGTSMATPHVTGVVALVRGQHPEWTYQQVISKILGSVDAVPSLQGKMVTGGRLNAAAAVTADITGPRVISQNPSGAISGSVSSLRLTFSEPVDPATFTPADIVSFTGPGGNITAASITAVPGFANRKFDITFATQSALGNYALVLGPNVHDFSGNAMNQDGDGVNGEPDDRYTASFSMVPFAARFDFGTSTSPVAEQFRQVLPTRSYNSSAGFGWQSSPVYAESRTVGTELTMDLNYGRDLTFAVAMPEATYQVTLTMGDTGPYLHDQTAVYLEGALRETVSTAAGQVVSRTYRVAVRDGQLTLRLQDLGGSDLNAVINGLEVVWLGPAGPRVVDSSPTGSVTGPIDRVTMTFDEPIQNGSFTLGDVASFTGPDGLILPTAVNRISDTRYEVMFLPQSTAGDYTLVVGPDIRDLSGNGMDQDQDGVVGEPIDDRFTAAFRVVPFVGRFDFGTTASPVAGGYVRVAETSAYSAAAGFGWQNSPISSVERPSGTDLIRDLCYGPDLQFAADAPNGTYDVTVTLGDTGQWAHDQMALSLEGSQVAILNTAGGEIITRTYRVAVNDGQLSLRLRDLGGSDANAVIQGLEVIWAGPDTIGPKIVDASPAGVLMGPVDRVTLTFDEAIDYSSFTPADVTMTGPQGAIAVSAVNSLSDKRFEVRFAAQTATGDYSVVVGPGIRDRGGNEMDQDADGIPGEAGQDQFATGLRIVPFVGRYDFGTATSPVAGGYARVTETTTYSTTAGFGWQSGSVFSVERTTGSDLTRDLCYGIDLRFAADLPNGTYDVTVLVGDTGPYAHDQMELSLEGSLLATLSTAAGEVLTRTYRVAVNDGQLTFRLRDFGGGDPNAVLIGMEAVWAGPDTMGPRIVSVNPATSVFGMAERATFTFNEPIDASTFTAADVTLSGPQGTIPVSAVNRLTDTLFEATFPMQTADGTYSLTVGPDVRDLAGNAMDQDQDGTNGEPTQDRFASAFGLTSSRRFDFGTQASALQSGYQRVSETSAYSVASGFGWQNSPIYSVDRPSGTDLTRDLCYGPDLQFAADVPNGTYDVTVTLGDTGPWAHDQMALSLEGNQLATLNTAGGEIITRTYRVAVNDGQLSLRLRDLGGGDANAVIQGLDIVWAGPDTIGPRVVAGPASTLMVPVDRVTLTFDEAIQHGTFTPQDAILTGPQGGISITAVNRLSDTRFEVVFAPQSAVGNYSLTVGPDVRDLAGNLMNQDQDAINGETDEDRATINFQLTSNLRFDFGTATSPVAAGHARVTETTAYLAGVGFGWLGGSVFSVERSTGTDLTRDLCYGSDLFFAVDVPDGTYDVIVTVGDMGPYQHDHMALFLEGSQVATLHTAGGEILTRTYRVSVSDRQLSLRLRDAGGSDYNAVLNGLEIIRVGGGITSFTSGNARKSVVPSGGTSKVSAPAFPGSDGTGQSAGTSRSLPAMRRPEKSAPTAIGPDTTDRTSDFEESTLANSDFDLGEILTLEFQQSSAALEE